MGSNIIKNNTHARTYPLVTEELLRNLVLVITLDADEFNGEIEFTELIIVNNKKERLCLLPVRILGEHSPESGTPKIIIHFEHDISKLMTIYGPDLSLSFDLHAFLKSSTLINYIIDSVEHTSIQWINKITSAVFHQIDYNITIPCHITLKGY